MYNPPSWLSLLVITLNRKLLLFMLFSLESYVVALYTGLFFLLGNKNNFFFDMLIFLTVSVCEKALGLFLLVFMVCVHGNDFILSFDSLW